SDADDETLSDAAGFPIADTTQNFTVDELTTEPEITSITAEDSGKVYVNFDRPMDAKTAVVNGNYKINDTKLTSNNSTVEHKKGDTQVKISGVSNLINKNSNTLYVDNNVEDAYGNKVPDDTYKSFDLEEDTTKPEASSVYALNDNTIRVKFNKDVDATYATNKSNYTLKDNDGTDITDEIPEGSYTGITVPGKSSMPTTTDVVDIKLGDSNKLTDSKYTLTIKNIQDTASTPNVMDDKIITFDGSSDVSATATPYAAKNKDDNNNLTKIIFVFNKAMDGSTLDDTDNYQYLNGKNETKTLPSNAHISVNGDNKSVTIDLKDTSLDAKGTDGDENSIKAIYATGVKDEDGNTLSVGNNGGIFGNAGKAAATVKKNSLRLYYEGNDLKANVSFTQPIDEDSAPKDAFSINGENPTSVSVDGTKVTLTFANNTKTTDENENATGNDESDPNTLINKVKAPGNDTNLTISNIEDVLGNTVTDNSVPIYSYDAAPKLIAVKDNDVATNWKAQYVAKGGTNWEDETADKDQAEISVRFDTPIEESSVQPSDFTFSVGGTTVDATDTSVVSNKKVEGGSDVSKDTVVFKFENSDLADLKNAVTAKGGNVNITVKPVKGQSSISTVKDLEGNYAYYTPSDDDLKTTYVRVNASDFDSDQLDVNAVAKNITSFTPNKGAQGTVELPTVPSGYTIAVKSTTNSTVYDESGKIQKAGTSDVVYTVTNTTTGKTADTVSIPVTVTLN
ncbi:MAG: hypothetical protein GXW91_10600, partial [Clostridiales bacterium]|nr:hypothetical protein [Clostridiales bacterium]